MGTRFGIVVEAESQEHAETAAEAALAETERFDRLLSTWDSTSALSRVNGAPPDVPAPAPRPLVALLAEARRWTQATEGAFGPTVGAMVDAWDLRGEGRRPTPSELRSALETSRPSMFCVDTAGGTVTRHDAAAWLDAGGFGKGAALRAALRLLEAQRISRAFLDLGPCDCGASIFRPRVSDRGSALSLALCDCNDLVILSSCSARLAA
jgi:thiamine biosynthesis lipoprotein